MTKSDGYSDMRRQDRDTLFPMQTAAKLITKVDGEVELFNPEKLRHSLRRSGARADIIEEIVARVEEQMYDGMTTTEIYRKTRGFLKQQHKTAAAKYSLRRALFNLGPTGFPFEDFLGELFRTKGYAVQTGAVIRGRCVEHEVDLVAHTPDHCFVAEAKFHVHPGMKSDLQVALYSHARFEDLKGARFGGAPPCGVIDGYVITNTKFTDVAIRYAECTGLKLLSWNYPREKTLQDHIEEAGIYPITALTSLSTHDKRALLENGLVLCRNLAERRDTLRQLGFTENKIETMIEESVNLCARG